MLITLPTFDISCKVEMILHHQISLVELVVLFINKINEIPPKILDLITFVKLFVGNITKPTGNYIG